MQPEKPKTISILLTKHTTGFSRIIQFFTRSEYTHSSLSLNESSRQFFSFCTKGGFRMETPLKNIDRPEKNILCALYRLDVTEEAYTDIELRLQGFVEHAARYKFDFWGAVLCYFQIPHRHKNRYICSQFISELLTAANAARLQKQPSLYLADDFTAEAQLKLCFKGRLSGLAEFFGG